VEEDYVSSKESSALKTSSAEAKADRDIVIEEIDLDEDD
jgi:hypothetical protein